MDVSNDSSSDSEINRMPSLKFIGKQLYRYTIGCSSSSSTMAISSSEDEEQKKKEEKIIRQSLKFHFMNPIQKWKKRRIIQMFPFKLVLQLITVILVTTQVILFGNNSAMLTDFVPGNSKTIQNLFLDMPSLDPADMAVYTMSQLYDQLATGVSAYYNIKGITVAPYDYFNDSDSGVPQLSVVYEIYDQATIDPSEDMFYFSQTSHDVNFPVYPCCHHGNTTCIRQQIMKHINGSNISKIKKISLPFKLTSFYFDNDKEFVSCVNLDVAIVFANSMPKGSIQISVDLDIQFLQCNAALMSNSEQFLPAVLREHLILDVVVFSVLVAYTAFSVRSIVGTFRLANASKVFFRRFYSKTLTWERTRDLQNLWLYGAVLGNSLNLLGTVLKIASTFTLVLSIPLQDATTLILGLGVFFQWCGLLSFFSYFDTYNILLLTLKLSLPSVLRFAVCAGILYIAFAICGWLVLGPYHAKFADLVVTSDCLFSLLNGDDMFATYKDMPQTSIVIYVFSKIYLYLFISLFIYVVLSVTIGLISDTYETLNEHWYMRSKGFLHEFALGGMAGWRKSRKVLKNMNQTFQESKYNRMNRASYGDRDQTPGD